RPVLARRSRAAPRPAQRDRRGGAGRRPGGVRRHDAHHRQAGPPAARRTPPPRPDRNETLMTAMQPRSLRILQGLAASLSLLAMAPAKAGPDIQHWVADTGARVYFV